MQDFDVIQLLPHLLLAVLTAIPAVMLFKRVGHTRWWALLSVVPLFGIVIMLWLVAFRRWPATVERQKVAVFD